MGSFGRALAFAGRHSLAIYLIHQPIAWGLHHYLLGGVPDIGNLDQVIVTLVAAGLSIGVATLSWRYFEQPLIEYGRRLAKGLQPVARVEQ